MGRDLLVKDEFTSTLFERASVLTGRDIPKLCARGPDRELARTEVLQPALNVVCLGLWRRFREAGVPVAAVAGHSVGELTALAASGMAESLDMVTLAEARGRLMAGAAKRQPGAMAAVTGVSFAAVQEVVEPFAEKGTLSVGAVNAPQQTVVSGDAPLIDALLASLDPSKGFKATRLRVSGAWHSDHMGSAVEGFQEALDKVTFRSPGVPMIFNRDGLEAVDPDAVRERIAGQLVRPVRWDRVMARLFALGITEFVEIGPGKVLRGLVRLNNPDPGIVVHNVSDLRSLQRTLDRLGSVSHVEDE